MVLKATIRFKSFCTNPEVAATKAVVDPIKVKITKAVGLYSKIGELLNSKYTPAVTRVHKSLFKNRDNGLFLYP